MTNIKRYYASVSYITKENKTGFIHYNAVRFNDLLEAMNDLKVGDTLTVNNEEVEVDFITYHCCINGVMHTA